MCVCVGGGLSFSDGGWLVDRLDLLTLVDGWGEKGV